MAIYNANQLKDFTLEISDREIYNDIRAECDITEILTVRPDATPELFEEFTIGEGYYGLGVGQTSDDWIYPRGYSDPDSKWDDEINAYDNYIETTATTVDTGSYLELYPPASINGDKIRLYARGEDAGAASLNPNVTIDIYFDEGWTNIFSGNITKNTWVTKTFTKCEVEIVRIKWDGGDGGVKFFLGELHFYGPASTTGNVVNITVTAPAGHTEIVWLNIVSYSASPVTVLGWGQGACEQLGGEWRDGNPTICLLPSSLIQGKIEIEITKREARSCTIQVTNNSDYSIGIWFDVAYLALTPETRYIKLRSINATSIEKYGRRAMDLKWSLGITPNAMQSLIDAYCTRYCEPICFASKTLEGETDAKITQILNMRIDDKHEIIHPGLAMDEEFFVNSINISFSREGTGILTGTFGLEQVRDIEKTTYFTLDVSQLDSAHVLAS